MDDRFNTIAGWTLFAGVVALGLSSVSARYFNANNPHRPEKMGYEIEGVEAEGGDAAEQPIAAFLATADVEKGKAVFAKCTSCHTIDQGGANGIGPNLYGVMGEAIGQGHGGFAFSDALKTKGGNWTFEAMSDWLKSPKAFAPGTKMTFAGLSKPEDRANLLVYMNSMGSNLPLPAAPAAGADVAPAGDGAEAAPSGEQAEAGAMAQEAPKVEGGDKAPGSSADSVAP